MVLDSPRLPDGALVEAFFELGGDWIEIFCGCVRQRGVSDGAKKGRTRWYDGSRFPECFPYFDSSWLMASVQTQIVPVCRGCRDHGLGYCSHVRVLLVRSWDTVVWGLLGISTSAGVFIGLLVALVRFVRFSRRRSPLLYPRIPTVAPAVGTRTRVLSLMVTPVCGSVPHVTCSPGRWIVIRRIASDTRTLQ